MQEKLSQIQKTVLPSITAANDLNALDAIRVGVIGKNGTLTAMMKEMGKLSIEEKKTFGAAINTVKNEIISISY